MKFLADENFPRSSITILRSKGYAVSAIAEIAPGSNDRAVLALAGQEERILLTFDSDYGALIYKDLLSPPKGIVYFRFIPLTPAEPAAYLLRCLLEENIDFTGKFTVAERDYLRQRFFP